MHSHDDTPSHEQPLWHAVLLAVAPALVSGVCQIVGEALARRHEARATRETEKRKRAN